MKTLYIIDGHAQFFRAYHAIRSPMRSPITDEPTNATFGFTAMVLKLLRELKPDYFLVVIDVSGDRESFRSELYPEYKANRDPAPQDFGPQVERCVSILKTLGTPVLGIEGVEADDVIATVVRRLHDAGEDLRIRIISKDKDLQQLIRKNEVELFDVHTEEATDVEALQEKWGVAPNQVIDVLTLMGDTADNVPGVPGVGLKTASKLINEFGSLDEVLAHAGEIKGKRGEAIRAAAPHLPLSRTLVTLKDDVDVEFDLASMDASKLNLQALEPVFKELGFNRFADEIRELQNPKQETTHFPGSLFDAQPSPKRPETTGNYKLIKSRDELDELIKELRAADIISVDTETTGLSPRDCHLCGISFTTKPNTGAYIPVLSPEPTKHLDQHTVIEALRPILEDKSHQKVGHNIKFDSLILRNAGINLRGIAFDTMIASSLVDSSRRTHRLDALSVALLNHECIPISDLIGKGKSQRTFDTVPLDLAADYAAEDTDVTLQLHDNLAPKLRAMKLGDLFKDVEMPLVEVLAELEWNGIAVEPDILDQQADALREKIESLRKQISDESPREFNPDSPKQLSTILFNAPDDEPPGLGIKPLKKTKTGFSTDVEVLETLATDPAVTSKVPALIVEYRQLTKLVSTYLVALKEAINPNTRRIHASFHQAVAATGRLSSSDPNLQNIPIRSDAGRAIRKAFVAPENRMLITADYSQIELRMLAHLSRDETLINAFKEGQDIHRAVAAQIHHVAPEDVTTEQRNSAKMVNFGIVYGVTPHGLSRRLGIPQQEAATIIDDYKARYPGITTFLQECVDQAERKGYVETILKRRRQVPQVTSRNPRERAMGERVAINSVVQGSAADLIKLAMIDLHRLVRANKLGDAMMLIQIHDELVFEANAEEAESVRNTIVDRMEHAMQLRVPLKADSAIAKTWFEGK